MTGKERGEEGIGGREGKGKETGQGNCGSGVKLEKGGDRKGQAGEGREHQLIFASLQYCPPQTHMLDLSGPLGKEGGQRGEGRRERK